MSAGDTQRDQDEAIDTAISDAFAKTYQEVVGHSPELASVMKRRLDAPIAGVDNAWREFRDHFNAAGEEERIRRKARVFAEVMANTPGMQGSIQGFIHYLKNTQYGEEA